MRLLLLFIVLIPPAIWGAGFQTDRLSFELGADGVMISGCHPGDCHYSTGNYFTRRRFAIFNELLDFMGVDNRRLTMSWVSASQGGKWRDVVSKAITQVKELGPFHQFSQVERTEQL